MKKLVFTTCLIALSILSYAQKVDIDKVRFSYEYRGLPENPQPAEYKTFSIVINAPSGVRDNYGNTGLQDMINIDGWKKVSETPGHLIVTVSLDDVAIASSKVTERVDIQKNKEGKETGRTYYYRVEVTYIWIGSVLVKDYKGTSIGSAELGSSSAKGWASSEYSTRKEAADYYNNNMSSIRYQLLTGEIKNAMSTLNGFLSSQYGFTPRNESEILWILDSKKHPEYQKQQDIWTSVKTAMPTIKPDVLPMETKGKLLEIIQYFDEIPTRFGTDEKSDKKLRYAAYFNKARIYLILDNPEAAIKEAEALIANAYDEGDGNRLKKEAETLLGMLKKNNTASRHFAIDLSTAVPPGK